MAIRACENPTITNSALICKIAKLMIVHTKAKVNHLLQKQKAVAASTMDVFFFSKYCNTRGGKRGEGKGASDGDTASEVLSFRDVFLKSKLSTVCPQPALWREAPSLWPR